MQGEKSKGSRDNLGKDVILFHGFKRGTTIPNASPYCLKFETYLRAAKLDYQFDSKTPRGGPHKKAPWITLDGTDYSDSHLMMEFLNEKFGVDLNSHLTSEEKAIAHSLAIMADEHLIWGYSWWRTLRDENLSLIDIAGFPSYYKKLVPYFRRYLKNRLIAQGIGVHKFEEAIGIIKKDLEALSNQLGEKTYMMGSDLCQADCSVFGNLAQIVWATPGCPFTKMLEDDFPNLVGYCVRIRETFWPDWNDCLRVKKKK